LAQISPTGFKILPAKAQSTSCDFERLRNGSEQNISWRRNIGPFAWLSDGGDKGPGGKPLDRERRVWYTLRTSDGGFSAIRFGLNGDIPVAGNYDGDQRTDIVVFRPSTGIWYILRSSDGGFMAMLFGLNGDVPVVAR
jgi:hypothetical protein